MKGNSMTNEEIHDLAVLLAKYHNHITHEKCSIYGSKMDRALVQDVFTTLFTHGNYDQLLAIKKNMVSHDND